MANRNICIASSDEKMMKVWVGLMGEELRDRLMLPFMGHGIREGRIFGFYWRVLM